MSDEGRMAQEEAGRHSPGAPAWWPALQGPQSRTTSTSAASSTSPHMMQNGLRQQILFYQRVGQQLEKTLRMYDSL